MVPLQIIPCVVALVPKRDFSDMIGNQNCPEVCLEIALVVALPKTLNEYRSVAFRALDQMTAHSFRSRF